MAVTPEDITRLRLLLDEKIPEGGTETDTKFLDSDIVALLENNGENWNLASAEGWTMKMAMFARLVDMDESGATRKLSQKFRQARDMVRFFSAAAADAWTNESHAFRALAKAMSLRDDERPGSPSDTPFSGYSEHINARYFPLKRMPGIMQ